MSRNAKTTNAKRNTKTRSFPIVLKTIIDDAMRDETINDDNAKRIRAKLRANANANAIHARNTSWIATTSNDYDIIRCAFDATYREQCERRAKRNAKTNATPRKRNAKTNVETTNDATNETNA